MSERIGEEISFRKLEVLLVYLEEGNLARAAERLDVSAVSVHRALHSLEQGVRCPLFRHEGRQLHPTDAARVLADAAREVLLRMGEGLRAAREAGGYSSDRLRIGSLYSLTIATVPRLLIDLKLRKPALQTELVLGSNADLLHKLRHGEIDAALLAVPVGAADIETVPLFEDGIFFAAPCGSRYAERRAIDLGDCGAERFVSLTEGFATYDGFVEAFRVAGYTPNIVMKVGDIFSLMNLVSGGLGCTLLPGRVRGVFEGKVQMIALEARFSMRQSIGMSLLRVRERDPNLLALTAVCRTAVAAPGGAR